MTTMMKLNENEYMPLRDVVFNTLRQEIIHGELKPGERLLEIPLAEKLGVSRTPIREAIRKLELEGLVVMLPRRGATVAGITSKNLRDVLEIRRALEELAIGLACERMTDEQLSQLDELGEKIKANIEVLDASDIADMDEAFHTLIYESTNNPRLVSILANLREQMYRYRLVYIQDRQKREKVCREHDSIMKALHARAMDACKAAVREHIDNQERAILASIQ